MTLTGGMITGNPALRRGLKERELEERAVWESHFVGVGAWAQGNVMERELGEMGMATLESCAKASQDPCGEGYRNTHHLRSERMSCDFVKRMAIGEGEYLVKKRKLWRGIKRKSIISSINEEGNG